MSLLLHLVILNNFGYLIFKVNTRDGRSKLNYSTHPRCKLYCKILSLGRKDNLAIQKNLLHSVKLGFKFWMS